MNTLRLKTTIKGITIFVLMVYISLSFTGCQNPLWSDGKNGVKVITGVVERGVEYECWILVSNSGKSYELIGEKSNMIKQEGLKVTVIGKIRIIASFCMQGTPLEVLNYWILD